MDRGTSAPIALFVYNRPFHLRAVLSALAANRLARESRLYIFSDGAKNHSDSALVAEVREICAGARGFLDVTLVSRDWNLGLARSVLAGIGQVLREAEQVIVLEDDILTAPGFLTYMNSALAWYHNHSDVMSVCAYTAPVIEARIPGDHSQQVFFSRRPSSWGWGTWRNRWQAVDWTMDWYPGLLQDRKLQHLIRKVGLDLLPQLRAQYEGRIDSWAIRWAYHHLANDGVAVFPARSLADNIGLDGSGTHCADVGARFPRQLCQSREFAFPAEVSILPVVQKAICLAHRPIWKACLKEGLRSFLPVRKRLQ